MTSIHELAPSSLNLPLPATTQKLNQSTSEGLYFVLDTNLPTLGAFSKQ